MTVNLTFFGGINEIGGNKILLEADRTRVFLDFGTSFVREEEYFEFPLLRPSYIGDLFKTGILPRLNGIYKNAGLKIDYTPDGTPKMCGLEEQCGLNGVLLSHAHVDHYGYLGLLRPDIPVYLSSISRRIIELRNEIREDWQTKINLDVFKSVEKEKSFNIGNINVTRYNVDHSVLGASAFIIKADGKNIVYTGDLRFHGNATADSEYFFKACKQLGVDILLCEGTRLGPVVKDEQEVESHALSSEEEVERKCEEIFSNEKGLLIYDASPADINRMNVICRVAKKYNRTIIFDSKKAYFLLYINYPQVLCPGLPSIGDFKIALSRLKLHGSRYARYNLQPELYAESYTDYRQGHEADLLVSQRGKHEENPDLIGLPDNAFIWGPLRDEILREPHRYLLYTSSGAHTLLHFLSTEGQLIPGTYIYGKAEPFKEEMEFSFNRLMNWTKLCGLKFEYAHTSGHMYPKDIERFVSEINPKTVLPIHTEYPELFKQWSGNVHIPQIHQTLEF